MPLEVLGPLVLFGVAGVVLLVHLLGGSRSLRLADEAEALAVLAADYPDAAPRRAILADDRRAALVEAAGGLGVVRAMGDRWFARLLAPRDAEARESRRGVEIVIADFGAPAVALRLADAARRAEALALADSLLGKPA